MDFSLIQARLCPDKEILSDIWKVEGGYSNTNKRSAFVVHMDACIPEKNPNCKSTSEVDSLFEEIYFTLTLIHGKVQLRNFKKPSGNPVRYVDEFHSQFMLKRNMFLDTHNFIRYNLVHTKDHRFNFVGPET